VARAESPANDLWTVLFDAGEWDVAEYEIEVMNK